MTGSKPCKHWAAFKCNYGDSCNFSHAGPGGAAPKADGVGAADKARQPEFNPFGGVSLADPATLDALGIDVNALIAQYAIENGLGNLSGGAEEDGDFVGDGDASVGGAGLGGGTAPKLGPCKHWAEFKCNYGDACKFSHDGPGGASPLGVYRPSAAAAAGRSSGVGAGGVGGGPKLGPCKHWAEHKCNYGDACKFSHDGPGGESPLGVYVNVGAERKTSTEDLEADLELKEWLASQGFGPDGELDLQQQQELEELLRQAYPELASSQDVSDTGGGGKEPCKFWAQGKCNFPNCKFSHDGPGSPSPLGTFVYPKAGTPSKVCIHFLAGRCNYGDKCSFSHIADDDADAAAFYVPASSTEGIGNHARYRPYDL